MVGKSYMQEFGETYHTHSVLTDRCLSEIDLVFYHGFIHMYYIYSQTCIKRSLLRQTKKKWSYKTDDI
jgi:hypothetical protein